MAIQVGATGRRGGVTPSMNVTPLVDVVLVLLIIFMVVTPLLTKRLWTRLPAPPAAPAAPDTATPTPPLVLSVDSDGVRINAERVRDDELPSRLARVLAARADRTLFFSAADDLSYGRAVEVMDLARGAGALTIAVLPEPPPR